MRRTIGPYLTHDATIALTLLAISALIAFSYVDKTFNHHYFYQQYFGPAVSIACGGEYVDLDKNTNPALNKFLSRQTDEFSCDHLTKETGRSETHVFQNVYPYLIYSFSLVWSLFGLSWKGALLILGPLFYASSVTLAYGLFRTGLGKIVSTALALAFAINGGHINYLLYFRDYAKAPFILAVLLISVLFTRKTFTPRQSALLAGVAGFTTGVGAGFRTDVLICIPFFLATLAFFSHGGVRALWRRRLVGAIVYLALFLIPAAPILLSISGGGNNPHHFLLGTTSPIISSLGLKNETYSQGGAFRDRYIMDAVSSYSARVHGQTEPLRLSTQTYDRSCALLAWEMISAFPADLAARVFAVSKAILSSYYLLPFKRSFASDSFAATAYTKAIKMMMAFTKKYGVFIAVIGALIVAAAHFRTGIFLAFTIIYFSGYPAIEYEGRHIFHIIVVPLFLLGVMITGLFYVALSRGANLTRAHFIRAGLFVALLVAALGGPLWTLRLIQNHTVENLFLQYAEAPREELEFSVKPFGQKKALVYAPGYTSPDTTAATGVRTDYLAVSIDLQKAGPAPYIFTSLYGDRLKEGSTQHQYNTSHHTMGHVESSPKEGIAVYFSPVYETEGSVFRGILMDKKISQAVVGLSRVSDLRPFPLLPILFLTPGWEKRPLYQEMT